MKNQSVWDLCWTNWQINNGLIVYILYYKIKTIKCIKIKTNTKSFGEILDFIHISKLALDGSKVRCKSSNTTKSWKSVTDGTGYQQINKENWKAKLHSDTVPQNSTFSPLHYNILYQTAFFASICDPMFHVAAVSGSLQGVTVTYTQYAGSCCLLCKTFHVHFCPHKI